VFAVTRALLTRIALYAGLLLLGACAAAPRHTTASAPAKGTDSAPYDFKGEGTVPAPASSDVPAEADVEEIPLADSSLDVTEAEAPPPDTVRTPPPAPADSTADGFRIQVFASSDKDVAQNAASVAEQRLGIKAYVDLDGGMYKVRVGDFADRKAADTVLPTLRSHYYPDAWVVPARVRVPRKP
jgi:cell division septation protein DedD